MEVDKQEVHAIRPNQQVMTRQRLPYFVGISGETVGAQGLSMHVVVIPPVRRPSRTCTSAMKLGSMSSKVGFSPVGVLRESTSS